jgi:hypothetical protein
MRVNICGRCTKKDKVVLLIFGGVVRHNNLKAKYPLRIIVFIRLITPLFMVSCCNDKQLGFDLHSTALAIVSIIIFTAFLTYCVKLCTALGPIL